MNVFEDEVLLPAMSRTFTAHSQIVCAILDHGGDSNYLSARGGMSFGVRRMFMTDEEEECENSSSVGDGGGRDGAGTNNARKTE